MWLKPGRNVWYIKDGSARLSTGCAAGDREGAERKLRDYLAGEAVVSRPAIERRRAPAGDELGA